MIQTLSRKVLSLLFVCVLMGNASLGHSESLTADQLMQNNYTIAKLDNFYGTIALDLMRPNSQIVHREMNVWTKLDHLGEALLLTRFNQPSYLKNSSFLFIENSTRSDDLWIYLPSLGKSRRILSSEKKKNFFGTDFSYGDIVISPPKQFIHSLANPNDNGYAVVDSIPRGDLANSLGFNKKRTWINLKNFTDSRIEYYNEKSQLFKTQTIQEWTILTNKKWLATKRQMIDQKLQSSTLYKVTAYDISRSIGSSQFTVQNLENP